jgi:hypothetical protein
VTGDIVSLSDRTLSSVVEIHPENAKQDTLNIRKVLREKLNLQRPLWKHGNPAGIAGTLAEVGGGASFVGFRNWGKRRKRQHSEDKLVVTCSKPKGKPSEIC